MAEQEELQSTPDEPPEPVPPPRPVPPPLPLLTPHAPETHEPVNWHAPLVVSLQDPFAALLPKFALQEVDPAPKLMVLPLTLP